MEDKNVVKVFSSNIPLEAHAVRNLLEESGIPARAVGDSLLEVLPVGQIGPIDVWAPTADAARARDIVAGWTAHRAQAPAADQTPWRCPKCGEEVEGDFDVCWNCEEPRYPEGNLDQTQ